MQGLNTIRLNSVILPAIFLLCVSPAGADSHFGAGRTQGGGDERQDNPWAVPQPPENPVDFQRLPRYRSQQYRQDNTEHYERAYRFVTPEILDSIRQQQTQSQLMYGGSYYQPPAPPLASPRYGSGYGGYGNYYAPAYPGALLPGAGYSDPLYDVPLVSPWGNTPDLIYRGQSYPLVPNEAFGGLPPIPLYNSSPGVSDRFFDPYGFSQGMYGY